MSLISSSLAKKAKKAVKKIAAPITTATSRTVYNPVLTPSAPTSSRPAVLLGSLSPAASAPVSAPAPVAPPPPLPSQEAAGTALTTSSSPPPLPEQATAPAKAMQSTAAARQARKPARLSSLQMPGPKEDIRY